MPISTTSPFLKMLRTTVIPSDTESRQIRDIISRSEIEIKRLEKDIARAQAMVDELHREQNEIQKSWEVHQSLLSPARRLPPELLAEIFRYCLPEDQFIKPAPFQAPLLICQICATWRSVAISTPQLWSALQISCRNATGNVAPMMDLWLSRSANYPLSISIAESDAIGPAVFDVFIRYSFRWQHIQLYLLRREQGVTVTFAESEGRVPLLETFKLHSKRGVSEAQRQRLSAVLMSSQRLREVSWHNVDYISPFMAVPWAQLTRLTLDTVLSENQCLGILDQCQNLELVSLKHIEFSKPLSSRSPVLLPKLSSLIIGTSVAIDTFLDYMVLPVLREFELSMSVETTWPQSSFLSLLDRSQCLLEKMAFHFVPICEEDLLQCLRRTNDTLVELTIQSDGQSIITDALLHLLTYQFFHGENTTCLSPRLEALNLYNCILYSEGTLSSMVQSRLRTALYQTTFPPKVTCIKVVGVFDGELDMERLKELRNEGLVLKVYSLVTSILMAGV